jgi:D-arabinose 1-dehydrogenase-like Zn-dependent alcohol dehydrogenase
MRAAQVSEKGKDFDIVAREIPEPGEGHVRVKVEACGICHGDAVAKYGWWPEPIDYPRVPGHEVVGRIDKVGAGAGVWKAGDRVGIGWQGSYCSKCGPCRSGDFANCVRPEITGITYDGGYAEYMIAFEKGLANAPDDMTGVEAGPLMCAGLTTYNSLRNSGARAGDLVAVLGVGGLGHLAVQYSKKMGFKTVAVARERIARARKKLGADIFIDIMKPIPRKRSGNRREGDTGDRSQQQGHFRYSRLAQRKLVLIAQMEEPIEVSLHLLWEENPYSVVFGHAKDSEETLAFSRLASVKAMVEEYPLGRVNEAFEKMLHGKLKFRVVLRMDR